MGMKTTRLARSFATACFGVAVAALLGACTSSETSEAKPYPTSALDYLVDGGLGSVSQDVNEQDGFHYGEAKSTLRSGINSIAHRYIAPVHVDDLSLNGIQGLATIDPAFALDLENGMIRVRLADEYIADFPRPLNSYPETWANLTTSIIRAARKHSHEIRGADNEHIYEAIFDGMLSGLDIFSRYSSADQARANRARRDGFGGIGIRFTKDEDAVLITHIQHDSPAQRAKLHRGDKIIKINNIRVSALSLRKVAKLLRGPVDSPLTLSIMRLDTDTTEPDRHISFRLKRAHIVPETVHTGIEGDVLKLTVTSFNSKTASSMSDVLQTNAQAFDDGLIKGVVMDLRGNPGGLLSQSVDVADLFLNQGRIIATRGRHPDSFHNYRAGGIDVINGRPLVVLVDGDSASAAEIVASALQDLGRAVVVGSSSYGKGTVQTVIRLPNDGEMTLTWSRLVSPSGYALHGLGVMPTVCATNTPSGDTGAILALEHIDGQRNAMSAWRAAGMIFDGRRPGLRDSCPAKSFRHDENNDFLMELAGYVLHDPSLYLRALMQSDPVSTASRY